MKWILLMVMINFQCINCYHGDFQNDGFHIDKNNVMTSTGDRNLGFGSKEDESEIHLHVWNDMNNSNNYYPNLMKHIMAESMQKQSTHSATQTDDSNSIHINLNEPLPQPQPQISPGNLLKNALLQTLALDEFRKSDHNSYGSYYKLKGERFKQSPISWNYHPSAINYIPKVYDTSINNAATLPTQSMLTQQQRPSLYNQMPTANHFIQAYYTNLQKTKPKSVIDAVGYEIGGLPKYSGRLLANEPMPQKYRSFKMFEPVPRQIMLPPPTPRIPEFKRVPPRLKIIPVIDEYLEKRPNPIPATNSMPWQVINPDEKSKPLNYLFPSPTKPVQIIPFQLSDAMTKPPLRKYIPKIEFNYTEPSTESYYIERFKTPKMSTIESITPEIATKTPKLKVYLPIQRDHKHENIINPLSQHSYESMNDQFILYKEDEKHRNNSRLQMFTNEDRPYEYEYTKKMNHNYNIANEALKLVSIEDSRSNLNTKKKAHRVNNAESTRKKSAHKRTKARQSQQAHENVANDVIKLNVTGFRNVTEDNRIDVHSESSGHNTPKNENNEKNYDKLRLHASNEYPIESVSADSIQLSQAYSRQITNVPHPKPTPPVSSDTLLMQLVNDVKKTLLTSLGNGTNSSNSDDFDGIQDGEDQRDDPFLIAVLDEHDRKYDPQIHLDSDLQFAETDRSDSFVNANESNNLLQRIDHGWTSPDPNEHIKKHNFDKLDEANSGNNDNNATKHDTQNERNSTFIDDKYYKWFSSYAKENKKLGRTVISEHFKKVEIEPNISWIVLPRNMQQEKVDRLRRTAQNETDPAAAATAATAAVTKCIACIESVIRANNTETKV